MRLGRIGGSATVVVASLMLHFVALLSLRVIPSAGDTQLKAIDVTFTINEPPPPSPTLREKPKNSTAAPSPTAHARPPRATVALGEPLPAAQSLSLEAPPEARHGTALDPESVARALILFQESTPDATLEKEAQGTIPPNYFAGVGKKRYLSVRDPPSLQPHRDGTYRYRGNAFKAIVEHDGSVTFDDRYRQGTTISFDITDHMMRKRGEDPYRVEKQWFLDSTVEFRRELYERWRAKHTLIAIRKLRTRLLQISKDGALSDQQKEARVVAIYQDTADDPAGAAARKAIAEFVAHTMPIIELPTTPPTATP